MTKFYITHQDEFGERHQLTGAFEADSGLEAIAVMLREAGAEDDGNWEAHVVKSEDDIIA